MAAGFEPATPASFEQSGSIQTRAEFDVIEILPVRAKELLRQLRLKACDANALLPEFSDRGDAERRLTKHEGCQSCMRRDQPHGNRSPMPSNACADAVAS